jgi:hypothetical protein
VTSDSGRPEYQFIDSRELCIRPTKVGRISGATLHLSSYVSTMSREVVRALVVLRL